VGDFDGPFEFFDVLASVLGECFKNFGTSLIFDAGKREYNARKYRKTISSDALQRWSLDIGTL
jgi:hypothetical protein